jgi:alpha-glucosidase
MEDGPGARPPIDRAGRDAHRHPMQWEPAPGGGFTEGRPWLPVADSAERSVEAQRDQADSLLSLYRELIALRRELAGGIDAVEAAGEVLSFRRGTHTVAVNIGAEPAALPFAGEQRLRWPRGDGSPAGELPPGGAVIAAA